MDSSLITGLLIFAIVCMPVALMFQSVLNPNANDSWGVYSQKQGLAFALAVVVMIVVGFLLGFAPDTTVSFTVPDWLVW